MSARMAVMVKAIRRQMGWTRKELAHLLGVSAAFVGRVERGEADMEKDTVQRLEAATGAKLGR